MNKNLYRIIFNKKRGLMMAVAETVASQGKGQQSGSPSPVQAKTINLFGLRPLAFAALCLFGLQPVLLQAAVVADPNAAGKNRPVVDNTANGRPLVQITTPSAAGVSRNQYNQYNVDPHGVILNNSQTAVQTQQGGYISANPYLATGSARIILNEVTGAGASLLRGYTEVAGQRAEVIIANPNGISCDGCGFINTSRGILTTGTPVFGSGGSLDAFRVTGGQITIGSGGLNAANLDQLDLISRSLQVNGQLWATNLNVINGANQVNYADLGVTVIQGDANKPTVGIDVALLGGMYANKIRLIGTEAGVGVKSLGTLAAQAGDFTLDNQGQISLTGSTTASGNLSISSGDSIGNSGVLYGKQTVQISSTGSIANSGTLSAQGNLTLKGASLNSSGILGAGIDASGHATQIANLSLTATGNLTATGQNLAGADITLTAASIRLANSRTSAGRNANISAAGNIDNTAGTLQTAGTLTLNSGTALTNDRGSITANQISASASDLGNRSGSITQGGTAATTLAISNQLDNTGGSIQTNSTDLNLSPQTLINDSGSIAHAGQGALNINTGTLSNNAGTIATNGQLTVNAATLGNKSGSITQAGSANTSITTTGATDNTGGVIASNGLKLSLQLGSINNTRGRISHLGYGQLTVITGALTNTSGNIISTGQTRLTAANLGNQSGTLSSTGRSDLSVSGALTNVGGNIQSGTALNVSSASVDNSAGRIVSLNADGLTLNTSGQLSNTNTGLIGGNGNVTLNAGSLVNAATITAQNNLVAHTTTTLDNSTGTLASGGTLNVSADTTLTNTSGTINAATLATLSATQLANTSGNIIAARLGISATDLSNLSGSIVQSGTGATTLAITNLLDNTGGTIQTNSADLTLTPQTLRNDQGTIAHAGQGVLNISTNTLSNNSGSIGTNGQLIINTATLSNRSGTIIQAGTADTLITASGALDNTGGNLATNGQTNIAAASFNNQNGTLSSIGRADLTVSGAITNTRGNIQSGTALNVSSASVDNSAGRIVSLNADGFTLNTSGQLSNTSTGLIGGNGNVTLNAGSLVNAAAITAQNNLVAHTATTLDNSAGTLASGGTLNVSAGTTLTNTGGTINAATLATLSATQLTNTSGSIFANQLGISATDLSNLSGSIVQSGTGATTLAITNLLDNTGGSIQTNSTDLSLTPQTLKNDQGVIAHAGQGIFTINTAGAFSNNGGNLATNGQADIRAASISNQGGNISAQKQALLNSLSYLDNSLSGYIGADSLNITLSNLLNNASGKIEANNGLTLNTQSLNNSGGTIQNLNASALNLSASQAVTNTANGFIGSNGQLTLSAASLDNTGSKIYAQNTLTLQTGAGLVNKNGLLQTKANLSLSASGALNNQGGNIEASGTSGTLNLTAASIDNTLAGRIANKGAGDTGINGGTLISNTGGTIGGNGNLSLTASTLSNTLQGLVFSGNNLTLSAASLTNTNAKIYAFGNLNFNRAGAAFDNSAGDISSSGSSTYNIGSITNNSGGKIASNTDISLTSGALYGDGQIIANRDLGISLQGNYTYAAGGNLLASNRNLGLNITGSFTNQRAFEAPGSLTVNASSITNQGSFNAYNTALNASYITNNGRIDGSNISTSSYSFTNNASIIGNNIDMVGYFLANQGGSAIIAATTNINLWQSNELSNTGGAEIYSMGDINIAGSGGGRTLRVLNNSSTMTKSSLIDAGGNINISAVNLDNSRPTIAVGSVVRSVVSQTLTRPPTLTITNSGFFAPDVPVYYESISSARAAVQYSKLTRVTNPNGRFTTTSYVPQIINAADIASSTVTTTPLKTTYTVTLNSGSVLTFDRLDNQGLYYDVSYYPGYNPAVNIHPTQVRTTPTPHTTALEDSRTTTTTVTDEVIQSAVTREAQIRASGNININVSGALTNYVSTIAAGNTLQISGAGAVRNQALSLASTVDTAGTSYFSGGYECCGWWPQWYVEYATSPLVPTSTVTSSTAYSSVLSGGRGAVIHAGVVTNSAGGTSTTITGATLSTTANAATPSGTIRSSVQNANGTSSTVSGVTGITAAHSITGTTAAPATPQIALVSGVPTQVSTRIAAVNLASVALPNLSVPTSGLYTIHREPGQKYLIETDKRFTNYKTYTGSDYLLGRLTIDPTLAQKRLGDGFYEQKLIADQIAQLTGRRFIGQYGSSEEQSIALMDSAVNVAQELKLSTGIALSKAQAAALTSDIVWMVEERITLADGSTTTALVPRVYLSAAHATELKPDGALIAADTIEITAASSLTNSGTLKSTRASMIAAQDIFNSGGSIESAGDLLLNASRDISNVSGSITGRRVALVAGHDILNTTATQRIGSTPLAFNGGENAGESRGDGANTNSRGIFSALASPSAGSGQTFGASNTLVGATGRITATDSLSLDALNNLTILGASIKAGGNAQLKAGNQLTAGTLAIESGTHSKIGGNNTSTQTTHLISSIQIGGSLSMNSGADMTLTAAAIEAGNSATLISGGNLTFNTVKNITSHDSSAGLNIDNAYDETVLGSSLRAGGNITLAAITSAPVGAASAANSSSKGNINLMSASISSETGKLNIIADNNITIGTTDETHTRLVQTHSESSGIFSSSSSDSRTASSATYAIGSSLSADSVNIKAGRNKQGDINIVGSSIAGTNDVTLDAANNLSILAATSTSSLSSYSHTSENGFMSNGGLSFTYGNRESTDKQDSSNTLQSQNRSLVGSTNGNLTLKAGGNALISGSDIIAAQDINVLAQDITINSGLDKSNSHQEHDSKQSGLTIALTNSAVSAAQTGQQMAQLGGQSKDPRIKALAAAATALAVANASANATDVSVSLTYGSSESHSDSTQTSSRTSGSTVKAGGNLNLVATADNGQGGNITIQGSDIKAGRDITLDASNNINLLADQSTASQTSHNSSSSSGAGVAIGTKGTGVTANAAGARGNADGNDVTYTNTHLSAGNTLRIKSGGDTNLKGATANGKQITADIGGNLNIESLQDTSVYASKQESYSASATVGPQSGASLSLSQSKISGNYASVKEQSGLKAGDGGFQVSVKGNTDLKGGVIESTQAATDNNKNNLSTATLTSSDIQNRSEYDAQSISVSGGTGGAGMPMVLGAGDTITSVTRSGISGATIKITDEAKQKQLTGKDAATTVATLNTDVSTGKDTSGAIGNNLDVNEVQTAMTVTQTFVQQAGTFVATQAAKSDNLKAAGDAKKAEADKEPDPARKQQLQAEAQNLYQQSEATAADSKLWQPGGTYRQIATALTAAAGGNVTGSTAQLVQGAAVNYIQSLGAEQVKHIADTLRDDKGNETTASTAVRATLHAIVACAGGSAQGADCGSAALGAGAGSVINSIMQGDPGTMSAEQKENRKNLVASLVTGIAATAGASDIAAATNAAVIETENNWFKDVVVQIGGHAPISPGVAVGVNHTVSLITGKSSTDPDVALGIVGDVGVSLGVSGPPEYSNPATISLGWGKYFGVQITPANSAGYAANAWYDPSRYINQISIGTGGFIPLYLAPITATFNPAYTSPTLPTSSDKLKQ